MPTYSVTLNSFEYRVTIEDKKASNESTAEMAVLNEYGETLSETRPCTYVNSCRACIVSNELLKSVRLDDGDSNADLAIQRAGLTCTCDNYSA